MFNAFRYEEGMILLRESKELEPWTSPKLDRKLHPEFYDTKIASNDGTIFRAHRCVLAARLKYFQSMFSGGWIEVCIFFLKSSIGIFFTLDISKIYLHY